MRKYPSRFMAYYEYFKARRSDIRRRNLISVWALNLKSKQFCGIEVQYTSNNSTWFAKGSINEVSQFNKI